MSIPENTPVANQTRTALWLLTFIETTDANLWERRVAASWQHGLRTSVFGRTSKPVALAQFRNEYDPSNDLRLINETLREIGGLAVRYRDDKGELQTTRMDTWLGRDLERPDFHRWHETNTPGTDFSLVPREALGWMRDLLLREQVSGANAYL